MVSQLGSKDQNKQDIGMKITILAMCRHFSVCFVYSLTLNLKCQVLFQVLQCSNKQSPEFLLIVDHPPWMYAATVCIETLNSILLLGKLNHWRLKYLKYVLHRWVVNTWSCFRNPIMSIMLCYVDTELQGVYL